MGVFHTWLDMYNHMDMDGSGRVDAREFEWTVRRELGVRASSLPDGTLGALWNSLDLDGSGFLTFGEFGHFLRYCSRGVPLGCHLRHQLWVVAKRRLARVGLKFTSQERARLVRRWMDPIRH